MKTISDEDFKLLNDIHKIIKGTPIHTMEASTKWEPKKQKYHFNESGAIFEAMHSKTHIGRERSTEELCKIASDRTIEANRLSAWLDEFGSGEQLVEDPKYHAYKNIVNDIWYVGYENNKRLGVVYMTVKDARALCEYLNNGGEI